MSGILTGSPPRTDQQWARDVSQRLTQLEQSQTTRVGSWTLSDQNGSLVATQMGSTGLSLSGLADTADAVGVPVTQILSAADGTTPVASVSGLQGILENIASMFGLSGLSSLIGSITLPSLSSIPILGPLLSGGGSILSSLIPGLDASKITSGSFPTSIISGLTGILGNVASLFGLSSLTGTPTLPGISSIPILGPLLSGGGSSILGSLIPGLDASKITSGTFPSTMITGLEALGTDFVSLVKSFIPGYGGTDQPTAQTAFGNIAQSITGLLGNPSGLLSGTATLPSLSNIPLFGQLLDPSTGSLFPNIVGTIESDLLGSVPIGNLTTTPSNMLAQPMFASAASIVGGTVWTFDGSVTATGATSAGAVTVHGSGVLNTLLSNVKEVSPGDIITESIYTMWSGLAYTGSNPIQLVARIYDASQNLLASPIIATVATPAASGAWQKLTGTYTVPTGAKYMSMGLTVLQTVTAGQVWFGNGFWSKGNSIPGGSVLGLGGLGSTITGDLGNLLSLGTTALGGVVGGDPIAGFANLLKLIPGANVLGLGGGGSTIVGDLQGLIDNAVSKLGGSGTNNPVSVFTNLLGAIPGTNVTSNVTGGVGNLLGDVSGLINTFVNNLTGTLGSGFGLPDLANATAGQATTTNAHSSAIAALQAAQQQVMNGGGTAATVQFAGLSSMPSSFTSLGSNQYLFNTQSQSNNQIISAVFASLPSGGFTLTGRSNAAGTLEVQAHVASNQVTLTILNGSGSHTVVTQSANFQPNAIYSFYCGLASNAASYQLYCNGKLIFTTYTDSGGLAVVGASNMYGGLITAGLPTTFSFADNAPPTVVGSTFRVNRTNTGTVSVPNGAAILPANFFDTLQYCSPDLSFNFTTNGLQVTTAGTYLSVLISEVANINNGQHLMPIMYRQGAEWGMSGSGFSDASFGGASDMAILGVELVLCAAGDVIQPGTYSDASGASLKGESGGNITHWMVTLANRSLL